MSMFERKRLYRGSEQSIYRGFTMWFAKSFNAKDQPVDERALTLNISAAVPKNVEIRSPGDAAGSRIPNHPPRYSPKNLKARILVAEDQRENQTIIVLRLKLVGADVKVVSNGFEAVSAVIEAKNRETPFDLVLMDMQMPVLDGYGATKALRDEGFEDLPIVALTAHALPEDREECLRYGCDDHVSKPISWNTLYETLAVLLNRPSASRCSTDR